MTKLHINPEKTIECVITFSKYNTFIVFVPEEERFYLAKIFPNKSNMLWKQPDNKSVISMNAKKDVFYFY